MKDYKNKEFRKPFELPLFIILLACLISQIYYIVFTSSSHSLAQVPPPKDARGGQSAPAPPGGHSMDPLPPGRQIEPPPEGQRMEPPPGGRQIEPPPGVGAPGGHPRIGPGGRITKYPAIPRGRKLTAMDMQVIETHYILHRWVLSDLLWGLVELENSKKYRLSEKQVKVIYPRIEALVNSVEVAEKSNRLIKGLFTEKQNEYIQTRLRDGDYMMKFLASFPPTEGDPIMEKLNKILDEKIKGEKK